MQLFHRHHAPSIRSKLITLVLACALPILLGYVAFAHDAAQREREHVAADAQTIAQALAAAVDRDLASSEAAARVLATWPDLAHGDLAGFHAALRRLLRPDFPAYAFELSGADGAPLLDTRVAYGAPLRQDGNEAAIRQVFASGDARTSGLHRTDRREPYVVSIDVPVWRDGKVAYVLSVLLRPRRIAELLDRQYLPPRWFAEVFDNQQRLVARSFDQAGAEGTPMAPAQAARLAHADRGDAALAPLGGVPFESAFSRSPGHRWTVTVAYPRDAARDMLGRSQPALVLWIAATLAISLALAWLIGGSIARAVRALTVPAAALGSGVPLVVPPLPLREAAAVADALLQVEGELVGYRTRLEALVAERTGELVRSNALLETLYASAPVGLCFVGRDLRFVMINDYLAAANHVPAREHLGRTMPDLLGQTGVEIEAYFRRVLDSARPLVDVELSHAMPAEPGVMRHWIASYYPVFGPGREVAGIAAVVLDITERKLQEQRNRDNEELFRALYEGSGDANMMVAAGAGFVSANQAAAALFGYATIDEFLALSPASASPEFQPDGRRSDQLAAQYVRQALETGGTQFEWLHRRRDGSTFHADVVLTSVDIGGKGIVQALVRDISTRVATAEALRAAGARLEQRERFIRTVTDHLPALVGYWDAQLHCRFANRPYLEWLGRAEDEVLGASACDLLGAAHLAQVQPYVEGVLGGVAQRFGRELRKASGEPMHTWSSYIPDFDGHGAVRGFYMLLTDVTELKRTGDRLALALAEAEQANRAKGEFLANISHEIRTPMNAIMGLARLLEEAPLGRRERGYAERMKIAAKALLGMLNDVLDFSRVEAGQLVLEHTPFRLDDVLASVAVLAASNAWRKGIEPVFSVAPDVPALLAGDPMRLEQVLLNLVGNAVKFTDHGEVVLSIRLARREAERVVLQFAVRDTGIGIAPDQQERMFEPFSQGDSSTSRMYGGAGLGLAISRRLVGLMQGSLRVASALGAGARFTFDAAFALAEAEDEAAPPEAGLAVLVADDNASAGAALAEACAGFGWQVDRAGGGLEALALLEARRYDLAFVDSAMPDLDGVTLLARARATGTVAPARCILMAADQERARLAALAAGLHVGAILSKPVTPAALRGAVAAVLGGEPAAPARRTPPLAARLRGLRLLLVEDNPLNQEVANYILSHAGATVDIAANGRIAVSMLAAGTVAYDAVLMDLQMPVMNGFEATEAIRALGLAHLPIMAMTANALDEDRRRALAAGMDAHLAKPIEVDALVAELQRLTGGAARAAAADPAQAAAHGIDLAAGRARCGDDAGAFAAVFGRFARAHAGAAEQLRAHLARAERQQARALLHQLGGVAANLGATEVAALARMLEQALPGAGADASVPDLAPGLALLEGALERVTEAARTLAADRPEDAPAARAAPAPRSDLARLLELLEANSMAALGAFEALRPALAPMLAPHEAQALADAVATLDFDTAAAQVRSLMDAKDDA